MNAEQIVFSLLLPTAISIAAAIINNQRQKRLEFNYDYRKFILDKRKEAYRKVELILNGFQNIHLNDGKVIQKFYELQEDTTKDQPNPLAIFNEIVVDAMRSSMWMSINMLAMLEYINLIFIRQLQEVKIKGMKPSALTEIGIRENEHLLRVHGVCLDLYLEDLMRLDDIVGFKRMKQKETIEHAQRARQYIIDELNKKNPRHN